MKIVIKWGYLILSTYSCEKYTNWWENSF